MTRWLKWGAGGTAVAIGLALFLVIHIDTPAPYVEWQIPEHPVSKAAYDYAHSIKLPDSVPKPVPFKFCRYNVLGLCFGKATRDEYFEHLCKTEAGEYVFKRVEGVDGIAELRPRRRAWSPSESDDLFTLEDPITSAADGTFTPYYATALGESFVQPPLGRYTFYDFYFDGAQGVQVIQFFRDPNADPAGKRTMTRLNKPPVPWVLNSKPVDKSQARFAVTFRGLRRERDREFGIAGTEVLLLDQKEKELLAVRRDFAMTALSGKGARKANWDNALSCLRAFDATARKFVYSVLTPVDAD